MNYEDTGSTQVKTKTFHFSNTYEITKTLSSPLSPRVMRVSASRYVTSNSPDPVLDGGLIASGSLGISNGGSCEKFPVGLTVVFSKVILIVEVPVQIELLSSILSTLLFLINAYKHNKQGTQTEKVQCTY